MVYEHHHNGYEHEHHQQQWHNYPTQMIQPQQPAQPQSNTGAVLVIGGLAIVSALVVGGLFMASRKGD